MFEDGGALSFGGVRGEDGFDGDVLHGGAERGFREAAGAKIGEVVEPQAGLAFLAARILGTAADLIGGVFLDDIEELEDYREGLAVFGLADFVSVCPLLLTRAVR